MIKRWEDSGRGMGEEERNRKINTSLLGKPLHELHIYSE